MSDELQSSRVVGGGHGVYLSSCRDGRGVGGTPRFACLRRVAGFSGRRQRAKGVSIEPDYTIKLQSSRGVGDGPDVCLPVEC